MLTAIEIENFRCIERAQLKLDRRGTGILGANASGKTSLLEAIYFLGHGRSFRTNVRDKLLRTDASYFRVVGHVETAHRKLVAGIEYSNGSTQARLAGEGVSGVSAIAEVLPIQVIDPGLHRVIEEGSARRRRLMDWGVFHVKHEFLETWRRYQRALQQRNAALRSSDSSSLLAAWESEMVSSGTAVDRLRADYVLSLKPYFERFAGKLLSPQISFAYRRGWAADVDLSQALEKARPRDLKLGTTTVGPHRADIFFQAGDSAARDRVSRGQQKLLAGAFILAQIELRSSLTAELTCLLLDDPAAELDVDNLGKLLEAVAEIPAQLVVTSVSSEGLKGIGIGQLFHVEQGAFRPVL